jgi:hypothetical protein
MTATVAGIHLGLDTHANRPAANTVPDGSIYSCSTHNLVYKSNFGGNSWATWATLGSGVSGALVFLEAHSASASSSLDFTSFISSTYDDYKIEGTELVLATNTANLLMEMGTGGGPTYDTGNNYEWVRGAYTTGGTGNGTIDFASTGICRVFTTAANAAGYGFGSFSLTALALQSTALRKTVFGQVYYVTSTGPAAVFGPFGMQWITTATAVTALRFIASSGNITSGTIRIYGVSKT